MATQVDVMILHDSLQVVASLALATGALADFLIAVALCYYLRKLRTGYRELVIESVLPSQPISHLIQT